MGARAGTLDTLVEGSSGSQLPGAFIVPRRPGVLIGGGIHPAYNRLATGAHIFAEADNAERYPSLWRKTRARDDPITFGWCVMCDNCHLPVRKVFESD